MPARTAELPRLIEKPALARAACSSATDPRPPPPAIGRSALYIASSTRDASSISSSDTAENPRTVPSVPGSPTIRDPFGSSSELALSPSPRGVIPSRRQHPRAFRKNSALCRSHGLATSTSASPAAYKPDEPPSPPPQSTSPTAANNSKSRASKSKAALPPASHPVQSRAVSGRNRRSPPAGARSPDAAAAHSSLPR